MIVKFFCNILFSLAHLFINLIPKFPSFQQLNVNLSPLFYVIKFVNLFINIRVVGVCLLIILVVYNIKFVWSILMWLIRKIPGVS